MLVPRSLVALTILYWPSAFLELHPGAKQTHPTLAFGRIDLHTYFHSTTKGRVLPYPSFVFPVKNHFGRIDIHRVQTSKARVH